MRRYIITENERKIIKRYLENGEKLEGFKVLLYRLRNMQIDPVIVQEDLKLIEQVLSKAKPKS